MGKFNKLHKNLEKFYWIWIIVLLEIKLVFFYRSKNNINKSYFLLCNIYSLNFFDWWKKNIENLNRRNSNDLYKQKKRICIFYEYTI